MFDIRLELQQILYLMPELLEQWQTKELMLEMLEITTGCCLGAEFLQ